MAAERTTTLSGRRLVAGGGGTAPALHVVAVHELATALTREREAIYRAGGCTAG